MKREEAVTQIQRILGFRTDLSTECINALQDAQVELESRADLRPWFLLTDPTATFLSTTKDVETVALPSDFLEEYEGDALFYFDSAAADEDKWTPLAKDDIPFLRKELSGSDTPLAYALVGTTLHIFPTPDAVYTLRQSYYKADSVLTTNIENDWLKYAPQLMIGTAGGLFLDVGLRDAKAAAKFADLEARGADRLMRENESRKHTNRRYQMGGVD